MKTFEFVHLVAALVSKTAGQPLRDVDPEANVLAFYDSGAERAEQELAAQECAQEILFEAGYEVEA
jgi:hypothetical protein